MSKDNALFLFPSASSHLTEVDEWLSGDPAELYSIAREWFAVIRNCGEDVNELMHDGYPTACVGEAAFAYVNVFKSHVNIGFYTGAFLDDPNSLLIGSGKRMRHVKLRPEEDCNAPAVKELISFAYADVKRRLG